MTVVRAAGGRGMTTAEVVVGRRVGARTCRGVDRGDDPGAQGTPALWTGFCRGGRRSSV